MNRLHWKHLASLTLLCLCVQFLAAQPFQRLQAYGTSPRTGGYEDLVCLRDTGANLEEVIAIGSTAAAPFNGVLAFLERDGAIVRMRQLRLNRGGTLKAEGICQLPSGDVVACFFDAVNDQTHVVRVQVNGTLVWKRRLPGFHALDVTAGREPFPGTQEQIFFTGFSTKNNFIAIEALDAGGGSLFAHEYDISGPYGESYGNEIVYKRFAQTLSVVGTVQSDSCPRRELLFLETDPSGAVNTIRNYYDASGIPFANYEGRTLTKTLYNSTTFTLGFDYDDPKVTTGNFTKPGLIDLDASYNRIWAYHYTDNGTGFFRGDQFKMGGLAHNDTSYMISGDFHSFTNPGNQRSAFALQVDRYGTGMQWTEYETSGAFPPNGTHFSDLAWDAPEARYYIGGEFNAVADAGSWPRGSNPRSFWVASIRSNGLGDCSTDNLPWVQQLGPSEAVLAATVLTLAKPASAPIQLNTPTDRSVDQCTGLKRHSTAEVDPGSAFKVAYMDATQQFRVDIEGDPTGTARLVNLQGVTLAEVAITGRHTYLDGQGLAQGIYLIVVEGPQRSPKTRKVVLQ